MSEYFKFLMYLHDFKKLNFQISISNAINNRHKLYLYLENIGKSIQENLKLVVTDVKRNDAIIRHALDTNDKRS